MFIDAEKTPVLTPPMSLERRLAAEHQSLNLVQRILSLFRSVGPGSDLTRLQLPPQFNLPKSHLQCYGESVYSIAGDLLGQCSEGKTSLERITAVVAWSISTTRPLVFGVSPYNPILGETHHVSRGSLNVLLEQVSHHPPVSALHATDSEANVELVWCQSPLPRFNGSGVEAVIKGYRRLNLLSHGESYELTAPSLVMKLLPMPGAEWNGTVHIRCLESGLQAELRYHRRSAVLGLGGSSSAVHGRIFHRDSKQTLREIRGRWDGEITVKDLASGKVSLLYNAKAAIAQLETPFLRNPEVLLATESAVVWAEVSAAVLRRDWDGAREAKRKVEEEQRRRRAERENEGELWEPKFFRITQSKDGDWECFPIASNVPPAPIVVYS
ncbi:oxysterol-binding protein-related protein 4B-like isoform X2 [Wolffia australiana]